ncbi:signal peptidase I [Geoglobus acetivorans]|uniref:signal peptidase I n=1 Tax=Geoglobus acetivorans TaxID=565033 RepID=UPI00296FE18F
MIAVVSTTLSAVFLLAFLTFKPAALIVLSGSMVPVIYPGDIVLVFEKNPEELSVGDIITFRSPDGRENVLITHRIINITKEDDGSLVFRTKGDAVEEPDPFTVHEDDIVGSPGILIPMLGYLHEKREITYFGLILIPSAIIMAQELRILANPTVSEREEVRKKRLSERRRGVFRWHRLLFVTSAYTALFSALFWISANTNLPVQKAEFVNGSWFVAENFDPYSMIYIIPPFYIERLGLNPLIVLGIYTAFCTLISIPLCIERRRNAWKRRRYGLLFR